MASSNEQSKKQTRVMIWSTPRSVSTAFARSMSARGDTELFWEPYLACYSFGPDRKIHWGDNIPGMLNSKYTYSYVNGLMDASYPNAKVLFAKCMVEGIRGSFDVVNPRYTHTFLIRHPRKMFRSLERLTNELPVSSDFNVTFKTIYHDLDDFYGYVQTKLGQPSPVIIDADDLVTHPEKILPKYCQAVGMEFTPKMLHWTSVDPSQLNWHCTDVGDIACPELNNTVVLSSAMQGQSFGKAPHLMKESTLSPFVAECVDYAMPVYERLYDLRIKP